MEIKSEDWESIERWTGEQAGTLAEEFIPGEPAAPSDSTNRREEARHTRRGPRGVGEFVGEAHEVTRRMKITKDVYGSEMAYSRATRKIEILLILLSQGTRRGCLRSWRRWAPFRQGQ